MTKHVKSATREKTIVDYKTFQNSIKALKNKKNKLPKENLVERMKLCQEIELLKKELEPIIQAYHKLPDTKNAYKSQLELEQSIKGQVHIKLFFKKNKETIAPSYMQQRP